MSKKSFPLSKVYQLIEQGPVVMVTTSNKGEHNVMTLSWHMMIDFTPPILACVIGEQSKTFHNLKNSGECVINIPSVELAKKVVGIGNCSGRDVDKFEKFHLLHEPALKVKAPLLSECYVNLECKVFDKGLSNKYNMFILEVVKAWIRPGKQLARMIHHAGKGVFVVDGKRIKIPSKIP